MTTMEYQVKNKYGNSRFDTIVHDKEILSKEASFALEFIEKWGMVAAIPDGEDSSGRQKCRMATPEEVVDRAAKVAELAFSEIRKRKWCLDLPSYKDLEDEYQKIENKED